MNDICIKEIVNVYHRNKIMWRRNSFAPRAFDAVVLFTHGEIEYNFSDKTFVAKKGDFLLLPCDLAYSGKMHTDNASYYVVDFRCLCADEFKNYIAPGVFKTENFGLFVSKFENAVKSWDVHTLNANLKIKSLLYSVLAEFQKQKEMNFKTTSIYDIIEYISDHIGDSNLNVTELCRLFHISDSQLRRNILKNTGLSPNEYIFTIRVNKAKNELSYTDKPIQMISYECGFSSPYYFSRCFSKSTGMSPSKYRTLTRT